MINIPTNLIGYEVVGWRVPAAGDLYIDRPDQTQPRVWQDPENVLSGEEMEQSPVAKIIVKKIFDMEDIKNVLNMLFKPGWLACDDNGMWFWYSEKPFLDEGEWDSNDGRYHGIQFSEISMKFRLPKMKPEDSLIEIKGE